MWWVSVCRSLACSPSLARLRGGLVLSRFPRLRGRRVRAAGLADAEELRGMGDDAMSRGLGNGSLQAGSRGARKVVDVPARVTDEVVVVLLLDQTETALTRTERELAEQPFGHQNPQGP